MTTLIGSAPQPLNIVDWIAFLGTAASQPAGLLVPHQDFHQLFCADTLLRLVLIKLHVCKPYGWLKAQWLAMCYAWRCYAIVLLPARMYLAGNLYEYISEIRKLFGALPLELGVQNCKNDMETSIKMMARHGSWNVDSGKFNSGFAFLNISACLVNFLKLVPMILAPGTRLHVDFTTVPWSEYILRQLLLMLCVKTLC